MLLKRIVIYYSRHYSKAMAVVDLVACALCTSIMSLLRISVVITMVLAAAVDNTPSTDVVLCVCLSNCSRTTGYEAAYERYQQIQCYKGRKINVAILLKRLRSRDMA